MQPGKKEKDEAIERVRKAANKLWLKFVTHEIIPAIARARARFTTDAIWALIDKSHALKPIPGTHERRAMGAVMTAAAKACYICKDRETPPKKSVRAVCHQNPKQVWVSLIYQPGTRLITPLYDGPYPGVTDSDFVREDKQDTLFSMEELRDWQDSGDDDDDF